MHPRSGVLAFALGLLVLSAPVPAATVATPGLANLTVRAERIIISEVIEVRYELDPARGDQVPVTLVTVRVLRTLKGAAGSHLVLEFLGGHVGDQTLEILDMPRFAVGDRDVLFLSAAVRRVSPLVGVMHGRFRLLGSAGASGERVAAYDGRLLTQADLDSNLPVRQARVVSGRPVSLVALEKTVLALVALPTPPELGATTELAEPQFRDSAAGRLAVQVNLGASPALRDGCPDWSCALESTEWFHRLSAGVEAAAESGLPAEQVSLEWGQAVFGRMLDVDTLALAVRQTNGSVTRTRVVFNPQLAWNAYGGGTAPPAGGPVDLTTVAAREVSLVAEAVASASPDIAPSSVSAAALGRLGARRAPPSRAASLPGSVEAAASGCGPGDVFVDPRLLVFDSPDHALMTAYQVGFFQPGAASPAQVIDVPLAAFLVRRVVDLPSWAALAMQVSLVADIRSAGLATPLGLVYTYRVRGVWAGGTTAWSDSSQPFVRCAATATAR